jgi:thiamine-phosphate pyrophosphorylase
VLALGGIGPHDAGRWVGAGADGVAVMGSVMRADDPLATTRAVVRAVVRAVTSAADERGSCAGPLAGTMRPHAEGSA